MAHDPWLIDNDKPDLIPSTTIMRRHTLKRVWLCPSSAPVALLLIGEIEAMAQLTGATIVTTGGNACINREAISDTIIIMNKGEIAQMGNPMNIYYHPDSEFVADFIGEANFLQGTVVAMEGKLCRVRINGREALVETEKSMASGQPCEVVLRPEAIRIATEGLLPCTVELSCFMGSYQNYHVRVGDTLVKIADNCPVNKRIFAVGEQAMIGFDKECAHLL